MDSGGDVPGSRLVLPSDNHQSETEWAYVEEVLTSLGRVAASDDRHSDSSKLPKALDDALTKFAANDEFRSGQTSTFFETYAIGSATGGERFREHHAMGDFDFHAFFQQGLPLMVKVALEMPQLFGTPSNLPIFKTLIPGNKSEHETGFFFEKSVSLTRRQCACLLAHSFFGTLKRPAGVEKNNFRFTVRDLFIGSAVSPNSAVTFLNYWVVLGSHPELLSGHRAASPEEDATAEDILIFYRSGFRPPPVQRVKRDSRTPETESTRAETGESSTTAIRKHPWDWVSSENLAKPLSEVRLTDGNIEDCTEADVQAEFANAFVGGGVLTGDYAMEELLFLKKPELMVAMALQNRMSDTEVISVSGALQYSLIKSYGRDFEFGGTQPAFVASSQSDLLEEQTVGRKTAPAKVVAIDAIRGGGPAMTESALLRDMNKARIAFHGAREVATGHWGCGAFGNHHDLMFLKQWLAASEAGVMKLHYYDFAIDGKKHQSHSIAGLVNRLKHMTVGDLWRFLLEITEDLAPNEMKAFSQRIRDTATGGPEAVKKNLASLKTLSQASAEQSKSTTAPVDEEPKTVVYMMYKGEQCEFVKELEGKFRLRKPDGKTTWAPKDACTAAV
eukprot:TRINITY_DN27264_c0_g1_i1.p1 TRINITY_DN27264_c0_g1~~TRINITY_DN27264_c0_g1_i1.p1  ORF type:complete len:632 (-),score=110.43 TRINITY_DN27264_c0_g1_i1:483-2330(-)